MAALGPQILSDSDVDEMVKKLQVAMYPRRIRIREFFTNFDKLRSGRCTCAQFHRAIGQAGLKDLCEFSEADLDALADHFTDHSALKPQNVGYQKFCEVVDDVYNMAEKPHVNEFDPELTSSPSSTVVGRLVLMEEDGHLDHLLHKAAALGKTRGITMKQEYEDFQKKVTASPARPGPRRGGKCTRQQFVRMWPFKKEFTEAEIKYVAEAYRTSGKKGTEEGNVHFMCLHNDLTEFVNTGIQPFPTSDLILKPDTTQWSHHNLDPVHKLQCKVAEARCRPKDAFQDFDPLRKGYCTVGQVKAVFTIMNLARHIDKDEFQQIIDRYVRDDGLFCYQAFVTELDTAFATPGLEKTPMTQTMMPDHNTTAPARRNKIRLTMRSQSAVDQLEDRLRTIVRKRGMLLKPVFQDLDSRNTGLCTKSQFVRAMNSQLRLEVNEIEVALLSQIYCDRGNHTDFNYRDFLASVDPPSDDVQTAIQQDCAPANKAMQSTYFRDDGRVEKIGYLRGVM